MPVLVFFKVYSRARFIAGPFTVSEQLFAITFRY